MRMAFRGTATRRREDTSLYAGGLLSLWCRLNPMNGPPRIVIALSFVQVFFVTAGYFVTRSSLKLFDRVVPEMLGSHTPAIPALPQFIRSHGLWCLLVPLAWSVIATSVRTGPKAWPPRRSKIPSPAWFSRSRSHFCSRLAH